MKIIYIVDDNPMITRSLKRLVKAWGYSVEAYISGIEFLKNLKPFSSGCILLDIYMTPLNGFEVYEQVLSLGCEIPVIFITVDESSGTKRKALKSGAAGFFQKPFEAEELMNLIMALTDTE